MNTLSFTQEYFLCAINDKGDIPLLKSTHVSVCLLVGGIMELLCRGYIACDAKKRLIADQPWVDASPYLQPLYNRIVAAKRPKTAKGLADIYIMGVSKKPFSELLAALGASLASEKCVDVLPNQGLVGKKTKYAPRPDAVARVIEKVRAEFLEDGTITDETLCLASLLDQSGLIRNYFSKVEAAALKKRLKEVRKSEAYANAKEMLAYADSVMAAIIVSCFITTSTSN